MSRIKNIMGRIRNMEIGEIVEFPIEWKVSVQVTMSNCNAIYGGKRFSRKDDIKRVIRVFRIG